MWKKINKNGMELYEVWKKDIKVKSAKSQDEYFDILNTNSPDIYMIPNGIPYFMYQEEHLIEEDYSTLPSGIYKLVDLNYNYYLAPYILPKYEEILDFSVSDSIIKDFKSFINSEAIYEDLKLNYKRGILVYGPPGTGKTSCVNDIINKQITKDSIVILASGSLPDSMIPIMQNDPRLKVIIFEEFTNLLNNQEECPGELLEFLDGSDSLPRCFIIATTNYPELLPKNVTDRPGRFDKFYKVDTLSKEDVIKYLNHLKVNYTKEHIELLVNKTIAEVKEIILIHKRDGATLNTAVEALAKQKDLVHINFENDKRIGYIL